jgi:hypothetical protein
LRKHDLSNPNPSPSKNKLTAAASLENYHIHKCLPLSTMSADPTVSEHQMLVASMIARIAGGLPHRLDANEVLTIWKDGVWHPYGECCRCNDLGPWHFHCQRCAPHGYLYVRGEPMIVIDAVNPQKLAAFAGIVHTTLAAEPDPEASLSHFLSLLASLWSDSFPQNEAGDKGNG